MKRAKLKYITAVLLYGTIGMLLHYVSIPSEAVVFYRGLLGTATIFLISKLLGHRIDRKAIRKNLPYLAVSGAFLGLNWVFLFAAYRTTTVAAASLCNYTAPIIVLIIMAIVTREKPSLSRLCCILCAAAGIVLVSGVIEGGGENVNVKGMAMGMAAAAGFVGIILINRKMKEIDSLDRSMFQLMFSACVVLPYVLITNGTLPVPRDPVSLILVLVLGIVHTGIAYIFYFGGMAEIPVESVAILGYIEPVLSVLTSALILREKITVLGIIGAVLIIGAALWNELSQITAQNEIKGETE